LHNYFNMTNNNLGYSGTKWLNWNWKITYNRLSMLSSIKSGRICLRLFLISNFWRSASNNGESIFNESSFYIDRSIIRIDFVFFSASLLPTYVKQESSSECWLYFGNVPPLFFGRKLVSFLKPLIEFRGAE
jgi:hypothetical protein